MLHCTSEMTKSNEGGALNAHPLWERVPRMHCMAEQIKGGRMSIGYEARTVLRNMAGPI